MKSCTALSHFLSSGCILFGLSLISGCGLEIRNMTDPRASDGVLTSEYRVFVTRNTYNGNLGGLTGADAICETEAKAAGLVRQYRAYLTDRSQRLADRFQDSDQPVYTVSLLMKSKVADLISDMLGGLNLFDRRENFRLAYDVNGAEARGVQFWGGYDQSGDAGIALDCESWSDTSGQALARSNYHLGFPVANCSDKLNLVCISDLPRPTQLNSPASVN